MRTGIYSIYEVLNAIKNKGIDIVFSTSTLPNRKIKVFEEEKIVKILQRLEQKRLIHIKKINQQFIITPRHVGYTINGIITDQQTTEHLIGATVQIDSSSLYAVSNDYGFYTITLPEKKEYLVTISYVGYRAEEIKISVERDQNINIMLKSKPTNLEEVTIDNQNIKPQPVDISSLPSLLDISFRKIKNQISYLFAEVDVLQTSSLYPGILLVGENSNGFYVRGSRSSQNLVILDEAIIYNPNHNGFVSIFNPNVINKVIIYKGYIPSKYGGRSSVYTVQQKEGDKTKKSYIGRIGPFSGAFTAQGPIIKQKSSYLASVRQSFIGLITNPTDLSVNPSQVWFQDLTLKWNYIKNAKNTFYLSGYLGRDINPSNIYIKKKWSNSVGIFRWNHLFSSKLFSNVTFYLSNYQFTNENTQAPGAYKSSLRNIDYSLKYDFVYNPNPTNEITFGISSIFHNIKPAIRTLLDGKEKNQFELDKKHGLESSLYFEHKIPFKKVEFRYGFRANMLNNFGPEKVRIYDDPNNKSELNILDTIHYNKNEVFDTKIALNPRLSLVCKISPTMSIKGSYTRTTQFIHLISNKLSPSPTDFWTLSNTHIPETTTNQYAIGFFKSFDANTWSFSAEFYYKKFINDISIKNGANLSFNQFFETEVGIINRRNYGIEFLLTKNRGAFTGWFSYTYSRSQNIIEDNRGDLSFLRGQFDRPHKLSITGMYDVSPRISITSSFTFFSGVPVVLPSDKYFYQNKLIPYFGSNDTYRLPDIHHLDFSIRIEGKKFNKKGEPRKIKDYLVLSLYNTYGRKNVESYVYKHSSQSNTKGEIIGYSVFGTILPGITYNFKF